MADDPSRAKVDFTAITSVAGQFLEEEGLFARDVDGQLIRVRKATADDFDQEVKLTIDGREVTVKKAVPQRDSQGNLIRDADGNTTPRFTTIFDAAQEIFVKHPGDRNPIPTLCHREHLPPVGVCRVCIVEAAETVGRRRRGIGACLPAVRFPRHGSAHAGECCRSGRRSQSASCRWHDCRTAGLRPPTPAGWPAGSVPTKPGRVTGSAEPG